MEAFQKTGRPFYLRPVNDPLDPTKVLSATSSWYGQTVLVMEPQLFPEKHRAAFMVPCFRRDEWVDDKDAQGTLPPCLAYPTHMGIENCPQKIVTTCAEHAMKIITGISPDAMRAQLAEADKIQARRDAAAVERTGAYEDETMFGKLIPRDGDEDGA